MTYEDRKLWRLGQRVQWALSDARVVTLRPSREQMKAASELLGIRQSEAWAAWNVYTWVTA